MSRKRFTLSERDLNEINNTNAIADDRILCTQRQIVKLLNELQDENEKLKQQLKSIEDSFKFNCTENHIEFNKDKLKIEDTHTKLILKDGKLYISVFIPQLNEYVKFFYLVTGRKMRGEFINYDSDVE